MFNTAKELTMKFLYKIKVGVDSVYIIAKNYAEAESIFESHYNTPISSITKVSSCVYCSAKEVE